MPALTYFLLAGVSSTCVGGVCVWGCLLHTQESHLGSDGRCLWKADTQPNLGAPAMASFAGVWATRDIQHQESLEGKTKTKTKNRSGEGLISPDKQKRSRHGLETTATRGPTQASQSHCRLFLGGASPPTPRRRGTGPQAGTFQQPQGEGKGLPAQSGGSRVTPALQAPGDLARQAWGVDPGSCLYPMARC